MKSMPVKIKNKLRRLQNAYMKAQSIEYEVEKLFDEYGVDTDFLRGEGDEEIIKTEALTFISYAEGDIEENIADIEEVFLYYVNNR